MKKYVINEEFLSRLDILETLLKNNVAGMFGGNKQSKYGSFGSSCEFADYRDYLPGDDITKIDWNSYARFEKLYLKLFLDERQMHTRIYIDASRSMDYGKGEKAEQAVLRREYIDGFKRSLTGQLESMYIVDEKGNKTKVERKKK